MCSGTMYIYAYVEPKSYSAYFIVQWTNYISYQKFSFEGTVYNDISGRSFECLPMGDSVPCNCRFGIDTGTLSCTTKYKRSVLCVVVCVSALHLTSHLNQSCIMPNSSLPAAFTGDCMIAGIEIITHPENGLINIVLWQWALILLTMYLVFRLLFYVALQVRGTHR